MIAILDREWHKNKIDGISLYNDIILLMIKYMGHKKIREVRNIKTLF